ncbi:TspO/MBR-related protein [Pholiota conissans]|uniref:TspO/MBR-related protein n=1 Tax=Pholiota conissans TaxID=109636 RepID=A0A9P6D6W0_9AGAR|nr:TspO/MBR-related protein [Pholiota conissans]
MSFHIPNVLLAIPRNPVVAVGLPLALGFLSSYQTSKVVNSNWYSSLAAPPGRPRREVFPFAWTILYLSMGYASHIAVNALDATFLEGNRRDLTLGIALYYAQLGLNCLWSPLFFENHQIGLSLIDSAIMTITTWYMTKLLDRPTNARATYYLLPYCVWLGYETYLNAGTWWLNRDNARK